MITFRAFIDKYLIENLRNESEGQREKIILEYLKFKVRHVEQLRKEYEKAQLQFQIASERAKTEYGIVLKHRGDING